MNTNVKPGVNAPAFDLPLFRTSLPGLAEGQDLPFLVLEPPGHRACKICGKRRPDNRDTFCSKKCANVEKHRIERENRIARIKLIQEQGPQPPEGNIHPADQEARNLYVDKGLGIGSIAKIQNRDKKVVKDSLVKMGVYNPSIIHNGTAKMGFGKESRKPCEAELEKRRTEKIARAEARKAASLKTKRHRAAVVLWALKHGIPAERALFEHGWTHSVMKYLVTRKSYVRFAGTKRGFGKRKTTKYSRMFRTEKDFCIHIGNMLERAMFNFTEEHNVCARMRCDFLVGDYAIEAKIETTIQMMQQAIGQLVLYRASSFKPMLLIPSDCLVPAEAYEALVSMGVPIVTELNVIDKLNSAINNTTTSTQCINN